MATVQELQAQASAAVAETLDQANGHLEKLVATANVFFSNGFNIDSILPEQYNYQAVPLINFPIASGGIRPTVTDLALGGPPEAPTIVLSTPQEVTLPVDDLLAPTHNFEFFEQAYQSTLLDPLKAKLLNDLLNGGYGIEPADEQALIQRARDREAEIMRTRIDEAGRSMAARGFPLPPDILQVHIDAAHQELQSKMSSVSRDIFLDRSKRFVENRQFTIEQVRQVETVLLGFHNSIQERSLNVAKAAAEYAIAMYNALLQRYKTRVEAAKISADVQLGRAQIDVARAQAALEVFRGQIAAYEVNLRRLVEPLRLQTELYRADIDGNRAVMDGIIARETLQQKVLEATVGQNLQVSNLTIENAKAKLLATVQALQFRTEAAKFGAGNFFALLSSMQNSINTLAVQTAEQSA